MKKQKPDFQFEGKYEEFADEFYKLCEKWALEDFDAKEILKICEGIVNEFAI